MGQYMYLSTSKLVPLAKNDSLIALLKFIGEEYKGNHSSIRIQKMTSYNAGIEWLNKQCKYGHKATIKGIIKSNAKKTSSGTEYRRWRFHRRKVVTVLNRLHQILKRCDAPENIKKIFNDLYKEWNKEFNLQPYGSEIASLPYGNEIFDAINDRERTMRERDAFVKIWKSFKKYDSFWGGDIKNE